MISEQRNSRRVRFDTLPLMTTFEMDGQMYTKITSIVAYKQNSTRETVEVYRYQLVWISEATADELDNLKERYGD